jgi:hypothetical protein
VKTRLEKKEIFIPLAGGADTSGDPRAPKSPTVVAENVDFNIDNIARKRDALATFVGNVAADTPTALGDTPYFVSHDGSVFWFGGPVREWCGSGSVINTYSSLASQVVSFSRFGVYGSNASEIRTVPVSSSSLENAYFSVDNGGSRVVVTGASSGKVLDSESFGAMTISDLVPVEGVNVNDSAHAIGWGIIAGPTITLAIADWNGTAISYITGSLALPAGGVEPDCCYYVNSTRYLADFSGDMLLINATAASIVDTCTAVSANMISSVGTNFMAVSSTPHGVNVNVNVSVFNTSGDIVNNVSTCTVLAATVSNAQYSYAHSCMYNSSAGLVFATYRDANSRPVVSVANVAISAGVPTVSAFSSVMTGMNAHRPSIVNGVAYVPMSMVGGRWWDDTNYTNIDAATAQKPMVLFRYDTNGPFPVAWMSDNSNCFYSSNGSFYCTDSDGSGHYGSVVDSVNVATFRMRPRSFGDFVMLPGSMPMVYNGSMVYPQGPMEYPEGVVTTVADNASSNFTNAGGAGEYYYCAVYRFTDDVGFVTQSAPSPAVHATVQDTTTKVTLSIPQPYLWQSGVNHTSYSVSTDVYRTSANGNDFYLIGSATNGSFVDTGVVGFSVNTGIDVLLSAKALYVSAGELENVAPLPHYVSCVHSGRYFYANAHSCYYSKSLYSGSSPSFNEVLSFDVSGSGGDVTSLESHAEKLFIGKERAWLVTYGEPLNDAGVGQGFAPPRIITQEAGVKYPTAAAAGTPGIFFINSVDGLIYLIDGGENVQYVGAPVRHYCETYAYDNVWYAPQDGCVRFSSATVGAPTLSFNYRYNRWSTFTGRYDDGIRAAFAAPVGPNNSYVDVVMDVNGNVYVQDPTGTNATAESFNVNISTSWISLGDILGYGKFYKWTLIGSKKGAALNLNLKTAYDYEPYWSDSQSYNASSLTNFSIDTHYGTMSSNTVVDQALKVQVDGSRHKTDAVRLCISENNGTARDTIELLGAKLEIGVRPGSTRLGSGRTVS